jgi:hypothetical protein
MGFFGPDKITLNLEKYDYKPGEKIKGVIKLNLKKPTNARKLEVGLFGEKKESYRGHDGKIQTKNVIIYDFKIPLGSEGEYQTGEYPFEITIPNNILSLDSHKNLSGNLGAVVDVLSTMSGRRFYPVEWFIKSQLDVPMMFDIKKEQKIVITA